MKYIKTKDGIIPDLMNECFEKQPFPYQTLGIEPIKISNNIEELCDEYVLVSNKTGRHILFVEDTFFRTPQEARGKMDCYGAIWTEWGLKYVAKLKGILPNGEIDWELI